MIILPRIILLIFLCLTTRGFPGLHTTMHFSANMHSVSYTVDGQHTTDQWIDRQIFSTIDLFFPKGGDICLSSPLSLFAMVDANWGEYQSHIQTIKLIIGRKTIISIHLFISESTVVIIISCCLVCWTPLSCMLYSVHLLP